MSNVLLADEMCCVKYSFLPKWNRHRYDNFHFLKLYFKFNARNTPAEPYVVEFGCLLTVSMISNPYSSTFKILISP